MTHDISQHFETEICCSFWTTTRKFNRFANSKTPRHLEAKAKSTKVTSSWPSNELTEAEHLNSEKRRVVTDAEFEEYLMPMQSDGTLETYSNSREKMHMKNHQDHPYPLHLFYGYPMKFNVSQQTSARTQQRQKRNRLCDFLM